MQNPDPVMVIPATGKSGRYPQKYWLKGYVGYERVDTASQRTSATKPLIRRHIKYVTRHNPPGKPEGYYVFVTGDGNAS
jgi:hypothetical protein